VSYCYLFYFPSLGLHGYTRAFFSIFKQLSTSWQSPLWIIRIIRAFYFRFIHLLFLDFCFGFKWKNKKFLFYARRPTDLDSLIFICNMLATSFSNLSWRPVLAVLFGAFLYVICLPMATQVRHTTRPFFVLFCFSFIPIFLFFF
jgi:hypothetical protein